MRSTPIYLNDRFMSIDRFAIMFSFMLGFASIFVSIIYALFTSSAYLGLMLFFKGAGISALFSTVGFLGLWKRHQLEFENCQKTQGKNCFDLGFFSLA